MWCRCYFKFRWCPGIAAMTNGLFKNPPADILVGPGNQFVAEAKESCSEKSELIYLLDQQK